MIDIPTIILFSMAILSFGLITFRSRQLAASQPLADDEPPVSIEYELELQRKMFADLIERFDALVEEIAKSRVSPGPTAAPVSPKPEKPKARTPRSALEGAQRFLERRNEPLSQPVEDHDEPSLKGSMYARRLLRSQQRRNEILGQAGLSEQAGVLEPMWNMLLDLYASGFEGENVTVSYACAAAGVPVSTALRYLTAMTKRGLVERHPDPRDQRRTYVRLSSKGKEVVRAVFTAEGVPEELTEFPRFGETPVQARKMPGKSGN